MNERIKYNIESKQSEKPDSPSWFKKKLKAFLAAGIIAGGMTSYYEMWENSKVPSIEEYINYSQAEKSNSTFQKIEYLNKQFSPHIEEVLGEACKMATERKSEENSHTSFSGFDSLGYSEAQLSYLWNEQGYPKGTIVGEVKKVSLRQKDKDINAGYGIHGGTSSGEVVPYTGVVQVAALTQATTVAKHTQLEALDWKFSHELGHQNDWSQRVNLTPEERVEFLEEVTRHFDASGSFRDQAGYIDSINNTDKKAEKYYKVVEYWGTLAEYYFTFPDILQTRTPQDYQLAQKWLTKYDPGFQPEIAQAERMRTIDSIVKDQSK